MTINSKNHSLLAKCSSLRFWNEIFKETSSEHVIVLHTDDDCKIDGVSHALKNIPTSSDITGLVIFWIEKRIQMLKFVLVINSTGNIEDKTVKQAYEAFSIVAAEAVVKSPMPIKWLILEKDEVDSIRLEWPVLFSNTHGCRVGWPLVLVGDPFNKSVPSLNLYSSELITGIMLATTPVAGSPNVDAVLDLTPNGIYGEEGLKVIKGQKMHIKNKDYCWVPTRNKETSESMFVIIVSFYDLAKSSNFILANTMTQCIEFLMNLNEKVKDGQEINVLIISVARSGNIEGMIATVLDTLLNPKNNDTQKFMMEFKLMKMYDRCRNSNEAPGDINKISLTTVLSFLEAAKQ